MFQPLRLLMCVLVCTSTVFSAQESLPDAARRKTFDQILDLYVRDGFVYYRALKSERAKLDSYVSLLATSTPDNDPREAQIAFWINAYNALVLRTIVDHYPIPTRSKEYPQHSVRQIPGAFERLQHKVAGRMLTLDQIEQDVLAGFHDPRVYLALGRGAVGGGRLHSEAYTPAAIEQQLAGVASECVSRPQCVQIDRTEGKMSVSAIFSWREKDFVAAYSDKAPEPFANRSPIERAAIAFVEPKLLTTEKEFLSKNEFQVAFSPFDWSLNDLTGRGGR